MVNKQSILLAVGVQLFTVLAAQGQERGGGFTTDPIKVVRSYEAVLADALKINPVPQLPTVETERRELLYTGINRMAPTTVELAPLTPLRALAEPPSKIGGGHLRVGGGNLNTPLADLRLTSKRDPKFEYGLAARHWSSSADMKVDTQQFQHAAFSDNYIGVYGKRYLNKVLFHSDFDYDRRVRHFYGLRSPIEIPRDSIRQVFNRLGGSLGVSSHQVEADQVGFNSKFSFYSLSDRFNQSENNLRLDGGLMVRLDENKVNFDFAFDYTAYTSSSGNALNRSLVYFQPRYNLQKTNFIVSAGLNLAMEASGGVSAFRIYPHVDFTYLVNDVYMLAYGGVTGNTERVSLQDIVKINPFVGSDLDIRNLNNRIQFYAGLKGSLDELTSYNLMASFQSLEQALFYLNDTSDFSRLLPVYDSSASLFNFRAEFNRKFGDKYEAHFKADLRSYRLSNLEAPFMQPTVALRAGGKYSLQNRLNLMAEAIVFNGVSYLSEAAVPSVERLNGVFDLNLGVDYQYNRTFSFFLNLNNVTSARYFRWYNYPSFGFNVLGGLNIRF